MEDVVSATCRFCVTPLRAPFLDLGMSPLANSYLRAEDLGKMEPFYPLQVHHCPECHLVQLEAFESPQAIFGDYAYFSSYSSSWLQHARDYVHMVTDRFGLHATSRVVEIASNDGYLLRNFVELGIPVLGVEPARNVAEVAIAAGIPTVDMFFGRETAARLLDEGYQADLLLGNNVLAHVPDLNDFVGGMALLLKHDGVITMEFPHLQQLIDNNQFDTIYHEHFSYFSFLTVEKVFASHGLTLFDVEEIPTHGGSLRIYAKQAASSAHAMTARVSDLRQRERTAGFDAPDIYNAFGSKVRATKNALLEFCIQAKREGKRMVGYGAPAKGNTLLNYCGIRTDFLDFTVDRSPHKHGLFLPGTRIPIRTPDAIREAQPDYVLILPWNLREEICAEHAYIHEWGGQFVVPIPTVQLLCPDAQSSS